MEQRRINGLTVTLRAAGSGDTVILLHCSSSHSGQWKPLMEHLAGKAHFLAPDLLGYGGSDPLPQDGRPWFIHEAHLVEALAREAEGKVHLLGHSLGGALAFYAARRLEDRVASLTMIEPVLFPFLDEAGAPEFSDALTITALINIYLRLGDPEMAARQFTDFWDGAGTFDAMPPALQGYVVKTIPRVADEWCGTLSALPGQARLSDVAAVTCPAHLVVGADTRPAALKIVDLLQERLPDVRRTTIDGVGHMGLVKRPDLVLPRIADWLTQHLTQ